MQSLGDLPASTTLLIASANGLLKYADCGYWYRFCSRRINLARKTNAGRQKFDSITLRFPAAGKIIRDMQILQFTQTLSLLLENGIIMVQALAMAERRCRISLCANFAADKVTEGVALSSAFKSTGYFDDMALDVFTVGENTGDVVPGLRQMSQQYTAMIGRFVKTMLGVISTGVLLGVFGMVGMIAFGIISAVFQLSNSLSMG